MKRFQSSMIALLVVLLLVPYISNPYDCPPVVAETDSISPPPLTPAEDHSVGYWLHDCSNLTAFDGVGDGTWPRITTTAVDGAAAATGGYIYATSYGSGPSWHGPLRYHTLQEPFDISQLIGLNATIEVDFSGADQMGEVAVSLHDEMNKTIASLVMSDRWVAQAVVVSHTAWMFSNYSMRAIPADRETHNATGPYLETLELYQNSTGIYVTVPRIGEFMLVDREEIRLNRMISYVSIQLAAASTYAPCDVLRVHDVALAWNTTSSATRPESYTFIDRCTTAHGWVGQDYWNGWLPWALATGTLESIDGYLHTSTNDGDWSGPFWFKSIDTASNMSEFHEFKVDAEMNHDDPNYAGAFDIILYDQDQYPIMWYYYNEWTGSEYDIDLYAYYRFSNGTSVVASHENITDQNWRGVIRTYKDNSGRLMVDIPGSDTNQLLSATELENESSREIRHIGISWRKRSTSSYLDTKLHDIELTTANLTAPEVDLISPADGTIHKSGTNVQLAIEDESGIAAVKASWDGNPNDTLSYPYTTQIPAGDGAHTLDVYAEDTLGAYALVSYSFTTDDTAPNPGNPSDIDFDEGETGHVLSWVPTDANPSFYSVLKNGTSLISGPWNSSGESISLSLNGLPYGAHNYTLVVTDVALNSAVDEVMVRVHDGTLPTIDSPADIVLDEGQIGASITWNPSDLHPSSYQIHQNSTLLRSGAWNSSSETISVSLDGLAMGAYTFEVTVFDVDGNSVSDEVLVVVCDVTSPAVNYPMAFSYTEGQTGNEIVWTPSDEHPHSYRVLRNGTEVGFGPWTGGDITFQVDGLSAGIWNFTLIVFDTSGNSASSSVFVTVFASTTGTTSDTTTTGTGTDTGTGGDPIGSAMMLMSAGGGGALLLLLVAIVFLKKRGKGAVALKASEVKALRGGEFVGNRFRFKVKVANDSPQVITDVSVAVTAYPRDSLILEGEPSKDISKIEPQGFQSPTFEFLPTKDCVKGNIIATVSYVDANGDGHSLTTKPFTIRAVCDLLQPESITPEDFRLKLASLEHNEYVTKVDDWTPEEMKEKTLQILKDSNFFEVTVTESPEGEFIEYHITGWAKGMYTGKNLGVQVIVSGKSDQKGATCKVQVSGEDEAMILPAIDEISQKLAAWLCPRCQGALPKELVDELKAGKSVCCPFCGVTMDR